MRSVRTKIIILAALLVLWALVFILRAPDETPVRPAPAPADARAPRAPAGGNSALRLRTDLLDVTRSPYPTGVQNFFSTPPPPPPAPPPVQAGGPGMQPPPVAPPPDPFQEEAKQLRYVGFLRSGTTNTAFIVRGQEVHTVAVGALLGERFRVMEVQDDAVILTSPSGDQQVRLSLAADAAVAAARQSGPPR